MERIAIVAFGVVVMLGLVFVYLAYGITKAAHDTDPRFNGYMGNRE